MKSQNNLRGKRHGDLLPALLCILLLLAFPTVLSAEILGSPEWGFAFDLPEGFALAEKSGTSRYHFTHELYPVDLQIACYPKAQFESASKALSFVTEQFSSTGKNAALEWRHRDAAVSQLSFAGYAGWALAAELDGGKGWLVMAVYTAEARATELEPLMISTLDTIATDDGSWFESGPMTAFAWAKEGSVTVGWSDGTHTLQVPFNAIDAEANQSVVDREFGLLTSYLDTPYVYDAWKRYYRIIWRDGWSRLTKPAFLLASVLPEDPASLAAAVLAWTQTFTYERNFDGSDFVNLPDAFATKTGDCDSRAMLMVILLNQMGVDAVLLVSPEYSHAVAAVDCPGPGARFTVGNKQYLIADTTSKEKMGMIAQDMADPNKWFAVSFSAFPQEPAKR
jgi:hypothetical protein